MNHRYRITLMFGLLLLAACDTDELDAELELDEPGAGVGVEASLDIDVGPLAEPETQPAGGGWQNDPIPGVDPQCMERRAPIMSVLEDPMADCLLGLSEEHELWTTWEPVRLFRDGSPLLEQMGHNTPPQLMRYCKYEYRGDGLDLETDYQTLANVINAYPGSEPDTLSTDCIGVGPMAGLAQAEVFNSFNMVFRSAVGAVRDNDLAGVPFENVRVGMLDTATEGIEPRHAHATQMRAIVADLMAGHEESIHLTLVTPR